MNSRLSDLKTILGIEDISQNDRVNFSSINGIFIILWAAVVYKYNFFARCK